MRSARPSSCAQTSTFRTNGEAGEKKIFIGRDLLGLSEKVDEATINPDHGQAAYSVTGGPSSAGSNAADRSRAIMQPIWGCRRSGGSFVSGTSLRSTHAHASSLQRGRIALRRERR